MLTTTAIENLQTIVPELMKTAVIPSVSLAIVQNDEIWQAQWGVMDSNSNQPVTTETIFQAASLSKPVFAYAVLQLVTNGQLDLDTPLTSYLPARMREVDPLFDHIVNEPNLHKITARHVLSHTPGFPNWAGNGKKLKTHFTPGTRFSYSGEGYHFLQRVVEHLVSQPAHDWIRPTLHTTLNMPQTSFTMAQKDALQVALGHDKTGKAVDFKEIPQMGAAYSLHCPAIDFAHFLRMMLRPSPITNLMLTPQVQVNTSSSYADDWPNLDAPLNPQVGWGLGWGLQTGENGRFFWQWGDNDVFKAFAAGHLESETAVAIFANSQNGDTLWRPILETTFNTHNWAALDWLKRTFG